MKFLVYVPFVIVIFGSANALYITKMVSNNTYLEYQGWFDGMLIVRAIVKIVTDCYMFP